MRNYIGIAIPKREVLSELFETISFDQAPGGATEVLDIRYDFDRGAFVLLLESPTFEDVPEAHPMPIFLRQKKTS